MTTSLKQDCVYCYAQKTVQIIYVRAPVMAANAIWFVCECSHNFQSVSDKVLKNNYDYTDGVLRLADPHTHTQSRCALSLSYSFYSSSANAPDHLRPRRTTGTRLPIYN